MSGAEILKDGIVKQGRLMKFENLRKTFRERYFVLTATKIQFLTADKEMGGKDGRVKGEFDLTAEGEVTVNRAPEPVGSAAARASAAAGVATGTFQFLIESGGKKLHCAAHTDEERVAWAEAIEGRAAAPTEALKEADLTKQGSIFQASKPAAAKPGGSNELSGLLERRMQVERGEKVGATSGKDPKSFNPYQEFTEFSRKEVNDMKKTFKKYDTTGDGFISFNELKLMMEKLGEPQTHLGLKAILKEVDEDNDDQLNLYEFLMIFRKAKNGTLKVESLQTLVSSVNVAEVGVGGAKAFFEQKMAQASSGLSAEKEIKAEQEAKKKEREEAAARKSAFKARQEQFGK
jgi:hypothetical protein